MIPALSPLAGFSPICWAVRVHMEHWARAGSTGIKEINNIRKAATTQVLNRFMVQIYYVWFEYRDRKKKLTN